MELLAILIALALFGLWGGGGAIQQDGWFAAFHQWLSRFSSGAALQLAGEGASLSNLRLETDAMVTAAWFATGAVPNGESQLPYFDCTA